MALQYSCTCALCDGNRHFCYSTIQRHLAVNGPRNSVTESVMLTSGKSYIRPLCFRIIKVDNPDDGREGTCDEHDVHNDHDDTMGTYDHNHDDDGDDDDNYSSSDFNNGMTDNNFYPSLAHNTIVF